MLESGIALDDVLELAVVDLFVEVGAEQPIEIVEAVAVHEGLDLRDEHGVEGFAQESARHMCLSEAADPAIDLVEAVGARGRTSVVVHEGGVLHCGCCRSHVAVEGIGGDEIHQRLGVDHVGPEIGPARVSRKADAFAEIIERWNAEIAAAREVDRGEIERLAEQALVQGRGDELIDLVHLLAREAERDGRGAMLRERRGIEEGEFERVLGDRALVPARRIDGVDGLADGRVAEAEGDLRIFERNGRIDARGIADEFLDARGDRAGILVDGGVLIFHFDDQLRRIEHLVGFPGDVVFVGTEDARVTPRSRRCR